jgi:hypothetical protein
MMNDVAAGGLRSCDVIHNSSFAIFPLLLN